MREFVSKPKTLKLTIDGVSHEMRCPKVWETEKLEAALKEGGDAGAVSVYENFFKELGLAPDVVRNMDSEDYVEFIKFVLNPKYQANQ